MSSTQALFTVRDYEQLPEGFPCELIEGHFVKEPAPYADHQRIISRLLFLIAGVIGPDRVLPSPVDIVIDDFNVLQPDVSVFSAALPRGARRPPLPTLVIEVLSASTAQRDRVTKSRLYLAAGIAEVWIIHPETGVIEVRTAHSSKVMQPRETVTSHSIPEVSTTGRDLVS